MADVSSLRLVLVEGKDHYKLAGDYTRTDDKVRDKNIWVSKSISKMMFYSGSSWVITGTYYMQEIIDGATGGFASSKHAELPYGADWGPEYKVSEIYRNGKWEKATVEKGFASPSVHIWWSPPDNPEVAQQGITWYYNEITVTESTSASYFMTNGFTGGYMGIQDRSPKWIIFSIWDKTSTDDDPNASPDDLVKVIAQGKDVNVTRFGGEGTGGKSYLEYDWKVGQTYQLMVNVKPSKQATDKAIFTGWFRIPELQIWRMLASFEVRPQATSKNLESVYSFLEDWIGTGVRRRGLWGPAWIKSDSGVWVQATRGSGTTTGKDDNNRNLFLSSDQKKIGMTTGGPPLSDTSLGPYTCSKSPIPSVLSSNPLPCNDGDPALE